MLLPQCEGPPPLGTFPKDIGSVRLPTFDADPSDGLGHLAAAVSPAIHATTMSMPPTQPQFRISLEASHYSVTNRLLQKLVMRIQALEFIEMSEMLPNTWLPDHQEMATEHPSLTSWSGLSVLLSWQQYLPSDTQTRPRNSWHTSGRLCTLPETFTGWHGWPMTSYTAVRHWLSGASTGLGKMLACIMRLLWGRPKTSQGADTA